MKDQICGVICAGMVLPSEGTVTLAVGSPRESEAPKTGVGSKISTGYVGIESAKAAGSWQSRTANV